MCIRDRAIASLSAGWFLFSYGWNIMLYSCVPILLGAFGLSIWLRKLERAEARLLQDRVR